MSKTTISNVQVGNVYRAGYIRRGCDFTSPNRFIGFKVNGLHFTSLKQLKDYYGVRNLRDLEFEVDRLEHGSVTAEFHDCDGAFNWAAYVWSGKFCVGTSGDRLVLAAAN